MQLQSTDKYVIGLYLGIGDNKIQVNYTLLTSDWGHFDIVYLFEKSLYHPRLALSCSRYQLNHFHC